MNKYIEKLSSRKKDLQRLEKVKTKKLQKHEFAIIDDIVKLSDRLDVIDSNAADIIQIAKETQQQIQKLSDEVDDSIRDINNSIQDALDVETDAEAKLKELEQLISELGIGKNDFAAYRQLENVIEKEI